MTIIEPGKIAEMVHTPGPWEWVGGPRGIYLGTPDRGKLTVLDFVVGRSIGQSRAIPRFAMWDGKDRGRLGGVMIPATAEVVALHPDAKLIAAAPNLLAMCRLAREEFFLLSKCLAPVNAEGCASMEAMAHRMNEAITRAERI